MSTKGLILLVSIIIAIVAGSIYWNTVMQTGPEVAYNPQDVKQYQLAEKNEPINIGASILPQFTFSTNDPKFQNLHQASATEREEMIQSNLIGVQKEVVAVDTRYDEQKYQLTVTPKTQNKLKAGLYTLNIQVKTVQGKYIQITQDFTWGVLAINPNKAIYQPGEDIKIGMGVLDESGDTKCIATGKVTFETAKVWLTVTSPSGKVQSFSTDEGTIKGSEECGPKTVTNTPDFFANMKAEEVGKYQMYMEAENMNGKRSIEDVFTVQENEPRFDIERASYPTRIYPKADYPVRIEVRANEDYKGPVADLVPNSFKITNLSNGGRTSDKEDFTTIYWNVDWKKGQTYELSYTITFPPVSPEFYLVGPLTIGDFDEGRDWQIASDAVWTLIQEKNNTTASGTTVSATFNSAIGQSHLIIVNCYRTTGSPNGGFLGLVSGGNSMSATSTTGGYSTAENNSNSTSLGAVWMFYKISSASEATAITCNKTENNIVAGAMGIQILEFSGGSNTITLDTAGTSHGNVDQTTGCATNPFRSQTVSATPTNANSLQVAAYYATAASRTVTNHIGSFVDTDISGGGNGFNNATAGSYDAGYFENTGATAKTDTADFNANGTACANVIATFNTAANLTQGSYRFYENANSVTPGSPLAAVNTAATLKTRQFRLRQMLLNDSPTGTTLAINGGHWKLQYATASGVGCASETYADVTTSTPISYSNNSGVSDAASITSSGNDPSDAGYTTRLENYYDTQNTGGSPPYINNTQLSIAANQGGLFDVSLIENTGPDINASYCLRFINTNETPLLAYNFYPQINSVNSHVNIFGNTTIQGGTLIE